jgi:probable F420-dependent oxidoreductase
MRIGAVYPQNETHGDPAAVRDIGLAVEELGYDSLLFYDHVVGAEHADREPPLWGPYTEADSFHDPFVAFGYLAAITSRIELATGVLILPQRQTVLVAQQAADADLLSGGRIRLGVGTGWNWVEYDALGMDFATRGARLDEQIALMRRLWAEPLVTVDGRFHQLERCCINPRPSRAIPIWIGGFSEPAFRRAAAASRSRGIPRRQWRAWPACASTSRWRSAATRTSVPSSSSPAPGRPSRSSMPQRAGRRRAARPCRS